MLHIMATAWLMPLRPALLIETRFFYSKATGIGSPIVYMGAKTGKDGVGGASMASESFDSDDKLNKAKRPSVQIGDPFLEKKLLGEHVSN